MNKLHEEPCGLGETGIEIQIPVQPRDIWRFEEKAKTLFAYFDPRPVINTTLPEVKWTKKTSGFVYDEPDMDNYDPYYGHARSVGPREWIAVMGCVPYKLDVSQFREELEDEELWTLVNRVQGGLFCNIGEVRISANREELKYTDKTKATILAKFRQLFDEFVQDLFEQLTNKKISDWARRRKAVFLSNTLRVKVPADYVKWSVRDVTVWSNAKGTPHNPEPTTFRFQRDKTAVRSVQVARHAALCVYDDDRKLEGYRLRPEETLVIPNKDKDLGDVREELAKYLKDASLAGIPVRNLSKSGIWHNPAYQIPVRETNKKHHVKAFRLKEQTSNFGPKSNNWDIVDREPSDDDVFVIISHFEAVGFSGFYSKVQEDRRLAQWLGIKFPEVYGYKTTARKPLTKDDPKGTYYLEWRQDFFKLHLRWKDIRRWKLLQLWRWRTVFSNGYANHRLTQNLKDYMKRASEELGEKHPITHVLSKYKQADSTFGRMPTREQDMFRQLAGTIRIRRRTAPVKAVDDIYKTYPLLAQASVARLGFLTLARTQADMWFDYIKLVDTFNNPTNSVSKTKEVSS
jgi:hypothetical protein